MARGGVGGAPARSGVEMWLRGRHVPDSGEARSNAEQLEAGKA
jgi:hypothetical protein